MIVTDATNLPRLMACNGSRLMQADQVFAERNDTIREEGNAAHWLASVAFSGEHTIEELIDRKAPNSIYVTAEMADHVREYVTAVMQPGEFYEHEKTYSLSGQGWQINGRADCFGFSDTILRVRDFKYGYTIVEPFENWTLLAHAIGFCVSRNVAPAMIELAIHQPRAPHREGRTRAWQLSYTELMSYYRQIAAILSNPDNELNTGTHCYKCPAFLSCPARQAAELNAIEASETAFQSSVSDQELSFRLDQITRAISLLEQSSKAYKEAALHRIKQGAIVNNYSAENDLANRSWREGMSPDVLQALTGRDLSERVLPSPRQCELAGVDAAIIDAFTERKSKGTKLVRVSTKKKAEKLFGKKS